MSFFDSIYQRLFPKKNPQGSRVLHKEVIDRKNRFEKEYGQWLEEGRAARMLKEVENSYYMKRQNLESNLQVHLLSSVYANGFAISYHPDYTGQEYEFLFDYLKNEILSLGYKLSNSDRQVKEKNDYIETIDKHYLKPVFDLTPGTPSDQKWGNILLEYVKIDDVPSYLKLQVSIYSDSYYTKALDYDSFLNEIFKR
jgi:hypothetical protein